MKIITKKYELDKDTYLKLTMMEVFKEWWWAWIVPFVILGAFAAFGMPWWGLGIAITAVILYVLFWGIQFAGITQHPQYKILFDKYTYEITSQEILIRKSEKEGMPIKWPQIISAFKNKNAYVLKISRAQYIYLPYKIFKSENDQKFLDTLLKRKSLLTEGKA